MADRRNISFTPQLRFGRRQGAAWRALRLAAVLGCVAAAAGCSSTRQTEPASTATEELLISTAADHAVAKLSVAIPPNTRVFLDSQYFDGFDTKYTISAIRDRLMRAGADMVDKRTDADMVVEIRAGAHSIDQHSVLIGLPSFGAPVPPTGTIDTPEIALFKRDVQTGVVKIAATAFNAKTGAYISSAGPVIGESYRTHWIVLLLISWTTTDVTPDPSIDLNPLSSSPPAP